MELRVQVESVHLECTSTSLTMNHGSETSLRMEKMTAYLVEPVREQGQEMEEPEAMEPEAMEPEVVEQEGEMVE